MLETCIQKAREHIAWLALGTILLSAGVLGVWCFALSKPKSASTSPAASGAAINNSASESPLRTNTANKGSNALKESLFKEEVRRKAAARDKEIESLSNEIDRDVTDIESGLSDTDKIDASQDDESIDY